MKRLAGLLIFGLATLGPSLAHADTILFTQLPGSTAGTWASQNDPGGFGNFATVYDNFTLTDSALVTHVDWDGQYFPTASVITAFTLTFYADNAGQPGAALLSNTIAGNANETSIGPGAFGPAFSYAADLAVDFAAIGGTQYWLSIVPDLGFPPQWGWNKTNPPGGGISFQDFFGERFQRDDVAFQLQGNEVPEPATMLLVAAGCAAALRRRRA
jgi:hypothetical protein